jgi:hypothetical protein
MTCCAPPWLFNPRLFRELEHEELRAQDALAGHKPLASPTAKAAGAEAKPPVFPARAFALPIKPRSEPT